MTDYFIVLLKSPLENPCVAGFFTAESVTSCAAISFSEISVTIRDDGDDLFETATAIVNIVTTVTDRHASGGSYLSMICRPA